MSSVPSGFVAWSDVSSRQRTESKMSLDRNGRIPIPTGGDVSARMVSYSLFTPSPARDLIHSLGDRNIYLSLSSLR